MGANISVGHEVIANIDGSTVCINEVHLVNHEELVHTPDGSLCGDEDSPIWRVTKGREVIQGRFVIDITDAILTLLLPKFGVTTVGGGVYNLGAADTLPSWTLDLDFGGALHNITGCYWTKWGFAGTRGSRPIRFVGEWVGTTESQGVQPLAKSALAVNDIYAFTDLSVYSIGGTSRQSADRFLLQVDNDAVIEFGWSKTITGIAVGSRTIQFATSVPYTPTHDDLHWTTKGDTAGQAISLTWTNAHGTVNFSMPTAVGVPQFDPVTGKGVQIKVGPTFFAHRSDNVGSRVSPLTITLS